MVPGWGQVTERPNHDQKVGIFSPTPHCLSKEEGLKMELTISDEDMMKPPDW